MGEWIDIKTQNNLQYVFIPENSGGVKLRVKATNDAHIALTNGAFECTPMTEIHIGGWNNTKSIIRRDRRQPDMVEVLTPNILNQNEYVDMWITWHNKLVSAGIMGQPAFIKYLDSNSHPINHIAVRTGWGSIGDWKIKVSPLIYKTLSVKPIQGGQLRWVSKTPSDKVPKDAFVGGFENGEVLYVARAMHSLSLIPGKYVPSQECAIIGFGLRVYKKTECEILCGYNASWVKTSGNIIPPHVFPGGYATETNSEPLFIGRSRIDEHLIPGKVHTHYKTSYIPYKTKELEIYTYEILVIPDKLPAAVAWRQKNNPNNYDNDEDVDWR